MSRKNVIFWWEICAWSKITDFFISFSSNKDCLASVGDNGANYRGTQNVTKNGIACQAWDVQTPHKHNNMWVLLQPMKKSSACIWQGLSITWALNDYKNKKWWPFLITCEMCFLKPWFPWFFYCGERKFLLRKHEFLAHCAKSRMVSRKHSYGVCHGYCWWKVIDTNDLCALNTFIDLLTNESWKISK